MAEPLNFKYTPGTPNELFAPVPVYIQDLPVGSSTQIDALTLIPDEGSATSEDIAIKVNEIITALKA